MTTFRGGVNYRRIAAACAVAAAAFASPSGLRAARADGWQQ
jgi:hypothetical protein